MILIIQNTEKWFLDEIEVKSSENILLELKKNNISNEEPRHAERIVGFGLIFYLMHTCPP